MRESPEIAALAKQARDGLDVREERLRNGGQYSDHHLHVLRNRAILGGWVVSRQNGVPSRLNDEIINAAVDYQQELFTEWQRDVATEELADVAARRTLLDEALGWEHYEVDDSFYSCPASPSRAKVDWIHAGPCDCGRDERVRAVLAALAAPYQGADCD